MFYRLKSVNDLCSHGLMKWSLVSVLAFGLGFGCCIAAAADEVKKNDVAIGPDAAWVERSIYFLSNSKGQHKVFVRRQPLRVLLHAEDAVVERATKEALGALAAAVGLQYEFTRQNPNLIAVVGQAISDGDRPNQAFLRNVVGLPTNAIEIVRDSNGWSSGCGAYSFSSVDAEVSLSLVLAERGLPQQKTIDCMTDGALRAFGIRSNEKMVLQNSDEYRRYVLLASAIRACDKDLGEGAVLNLEDGVKKKYVECAVDRLKKSAIRN